MNTIDLGTNNYSFQETNAVLKTEKSFQKPDFWDKLPSHVKAGVLESREQIKQGKFKTHDEVMKRFLK